MNMNLIGSEQVVAAARMIEHAAAGIATATNSLEVALTAHARSMDEWLNCFRTTIFEAEDRARKMRESHPAKRPLTPNQSTGGG